VWPFFAQIALGWTLAGAAEAWLVVVLLVLFVLVLTAFARDTGRTVIESIRLRYANEDLLAQKEQLIELLRVAFDKAEAARVKAEEANRGKSQFLASASHDLRQPLHALSLLTSLLNDMTDDARVREVGRHIDRSVQSLDGLFGALLDLSKLDAGAVTPDRRATGLADLVERLTVEYQPKAQEKGLIYVADVEQIWLHTDPILLERIVRNLLENAIRFTPAGRVAIHGRRTGQSAVLSVSDTGIGIPETEQARIFEEFYQLNNPSRDRSRGLGLGLSIVKRLTALLGYDLKLSSSTGRGSVFAVTVPETDLVAAPDQPVARDDQHATDDVEGLVVLIVEDDAEVRSAISLTLQRWGCRPLVVASYEEARAVLGATGLRPDVLISDLRLGQGASGIETIAALQTEYGAMPAAVVTGDIAAERLAEVRASGLPVLHKPVQARELRALVKELARPTAAP
jgi:signal transduction histidine kinase/ActR/RegA family two-component response regulator